MSVELFSHDEPVLVVVGPTAIGKTALSLAIAERYNCEIISLDSMQVYRYMDIGTAKASLQERQQIPHHLILGFHTILHLLTLNENHHT